MSQWLNEKKMLFMYFCIFKISADVVTYSIYYPCSDSKRNYLNYSKQSNKNLLLYFNIQIFILYTWQTYHKTFFLYCNTYISNICIGRIHLISGYNFQ